MLKSKLLSLIRAFDAAECLEFDHFLAAPLLSKGGHSDDQLALFRHIRQFAPEYTDPALHKEAVFAHLYPGLPFAKNKLDKLMSELVGSLERFIQMQHFLPATGSFEAELALAVFFRQRGEEKRFLRQLNKMRRLLDRSQVRDEAYFYRQFQLERELTEFRGSLNRRSDDLNLPALLRSVDWYYLHTKLAYAVILLSQNIHISLDLEDSLQLLESLEPELREADPVVEIYYRAFRLLRSPDYGTQKELMELRDSLVAHEAMIPTDQQKLLRSLLRIRAIGQYNQGKESYLEVAFGLYQEHLHEGYLYQSGKLTPSTFRNIVTLGLRAGADEWVAGFLEGHRNRIGGTNEPEAIYQFNVANLHFHRGEYEDCLDCLAEKYEDLYYQLAARRLEIMAYFEQRSPLLDAKLEAFKVYIFRASKKNLPEKPKRGNNNFIDLLRQILNPKTLGNATRLKKLQAKLSTKTIVAERAWLAQKLEEFQD